MIKTTEMLVSELIHYANPTSKIRQLVLNKKIFQLVKGIYETNGDLPGHILSFIIYGQSYLSFEYVLSHYSLIPEAVYVFTSATHNKRKTKQYHNHFGTYLYRDVPSDVFNLGIDYQIEHGYGYLMASPEKAICDVLYKISPVNNRSKLELLLFTDLRVDEVELLRLDLKKLIEIAQMYKTKNHRLFVSLIKQKIRKMNQK